MKNITHLFKSTNNLTEGVTAKIAYIGKGYKAKATVFQNGKQIASEIFSVVYEANGAAKMCPVQAASIWLSENLISEANIDFPEGY